MSLLDEVAGIQEEALKRIEQADSLQSLQELQVAYLGRKGSVTAILKQLKNLPLDERKAVGAAANQCRAVIEKRLELARRRLADTGRRTILDPTLPGTAQRIGVIHILNQVMGEICDTFYGMGFEQAYGPDVETDYYNFEALNFPPDHPARDMQDRGQRHREAGNRYVSREDGVDTSFEVRKCLAELADRALHRINEIEDLAAADQSRADRDVRLGRARRRLVSGFYDSDDVKGKIAERLADEIERSADNDTEPAK